jgi:hypothetical protein
MSAFACSTPPVARIGSAASLSSATDTCWLLVIGATAVIRYAQKHGTKNLPWLGRLMERRPAKVAAVALANKIARKAWAIMVHGDRYKESKLSMAAWQEPTDRSATPIGEGLTT